MESRIQKCKIVSLSICALAGLYSPNAEAKNDRKPNVIIVLTDDQGFGDIGFYGNPIVKTPVLDNLARESVRFNYLAFNAPHVPLQIPKEYYERYNGLDPSKGFEHDPRPFPETNDKEKESARKVYAMVSNIDDNVGRILNKLKQLN